MEFTSSSATVIIPSRLLFLQPNSNNILSAYPMARSAREFTTSFLIRTSRPSAPMKTTSRSNASFRSRCQKMYVPGFGESPEAKAANYLVSFFTYIALEVVVSQLRSYNREGYAELMEFVEANPLKDGDEFCAALMRQSSRHQAFALRILEVRSAYSKMDFEWDNLKRLALKKVGDSNTRLMRDYVLETTHVDSDDK
ncbi:Chaperonin-like RBCX protein 1, chloroplastic [Linum grandiflorum]